jgi:hypothetical protein
MLICVCVKTACTYYACTGTDVLNLLKYDGHQIKIDFKILHNVIPNFSIV